MAAQVSVGNQGARFESSYSCLNEAQLVAEAMHNAVLETEAWFWSEGCGTTVDAAFVVFGFGVTRAVVKNSTAILFRRARDGSTAEQIAAAAQLYASRGNALGATGALVGVALGETVNNALCNTLEDWVRD